MFLKNIFSLYVTLFIRRNRLFQITVFLYFTKAVAAIHSSLDTVLMLEEHLQSCIMHIQCIWQIFLFKAYCYFKGALAAILLGDTVIIIASSDIAFLSYCLFLEQTLVVIPFFKGTKLIIIPITATHSMIPPWFQACMYWKMVCYLTTSVAAIHFFLVLSLFYGSTWSNPLCQGHCVYFTTLIAATYYNKRPLVDSKKLKSTVLIWRKQL